MEDFTILHRFYYASRHANSETLAMTSGDTSPWHAYPWWDSNPHLIKARSLIQWLCQFAYRGIGGISLSFGTLIIWQYQTDSYENFLSYYNGSMSFFYLLEFHKTIKNIPPVMWHCLQFYHSYFLFMRTLKEHYPISY